MRGSEFTARSVGHSVTGQAQVRSMRRVVGGARGEEPGTWAAFEVVLVVRDKGLRLLSFVSIFGCG